MHPGDDFMLQILRTNPKYWTEMSKAEVSP